MAGLFAPVRPRPADLWTAWAKLVTNAAAGIIARAAIAKSAIITCWKPIERMLNAKVVQNHIKSESLKDLRTVTSAAKPTHTFPNLLISYHLNGGKPDREFWLEISSFAASPVETLPGIFENLSLSFKIL
ncbi:MAG: hypothetical protein D6816_02305 [Bacteroidetes bacterium]|nr:MAG: hypothetical protein D6816_02305 [Bacteroidota bacterium]